MITLTWGAEEKRGWVWKEAIDKTKENREKEKEKRRNCAAGGLISLDLFPSG